MIEIDRAFDVAVADGLDELKRERILRSTHSRT
jgi:hypothetical protein